MLCEWYSYHKKFTLIPALDTKSNITKNLTGTCHMDRKLVLTCVDSGSVLATIPIKYTPLACCFSPLSDCIAFANHQYTTSIVSLLNIDDSARQVLKRNAMERLCSRREIAVYLVIIMNRRRDLGKPALINHKDFYKVTSYFFDFWRDHVAFNPR